MQLIAFGGLTLFVCKSQQLSGNVLRQAKHPLALMVRCLGGTDSWTAGHSSKTIYHTRLKVLALQ